MSRTTLRAALVALAIAGTALGASQASAFDPFRHGPGFAHFPGLGLGLVVGLPVRAPVWGYGYGGGHGFGWGYGGHSYSAYGLADFGGCVRKRMIDEDGDLVIRRVCY